MCRSQDGLFLESTVNSHKLVLCSLLSMSPGTGRKSCKDVGRMGQRIEDLRGYFRMILLLYLPKQGCYHGNGMPEFYTRRSMRGSEQWPVGTGRDAIVPPAMSHFADPCLSKGVIRFPGR